ncbi:hypothetical protein Xph01_09350 [Micromonospora phaseoli]|nr:hypothetical protein Xph01_09350 [Micromonospora phaseoli]
MHQVDSQPILQRPDLLAECGLRQEGALGGAAEVEFLRKYQKKPHLTQAWLQAPSLRNGSNHSQKTIKSRQKQIVCSLISPAVSRQD